MATQQTPNSVGTANLVTPADSPFSWRPAPETLKDQATILVIDGEEVSRRVLRAMLKAAPYRILEAGRPADAFAILDRGNVDLIVIDLVMPEMDGAELCRRIKANRRTQLVQIGRAHV